MVTSLYPSGNVVIDVKIVFFVNTRIVIIAVKIIRK